MEIKLILNHTCFNRLYSNKLTKNTFMLGLLNASKMLFPLFTFPYLTRVLSIDGYALMVYVRAVMSYFQMWIDFGFMLSATKKIVLAGSDIALINRIVSNTIAAKLVLFIIGSTAVIAVSLCIPLLRQNLLFVWLSTGGVFLSCFIVDYLFRGLEKMHEITIRFVTVKGVSTVLTFVFIHSDKDLLKIPLLDILSSLIALALIYFQLKKYHISFVRPHLIHVWHHLKESFEYFLSNVAVTAFGALNTLLIGIFLPEADIAIWSVAFQLVVVSQMGYGPIIDAVYPEMMRSKNLTLIKKILWFIMPIILVGCIILYIAAPFIFTLVAGNKYLPAVPIFRLMLPVVLFAFPAMLCGWPSLGAIGKVRQTTLTTVLSACTQCIGLGGLILFNQFTLPAIAIARNLTEVVLLGTRASFVYKYRKEFK